MKSSKNTGWARIHRQIFDHEFWTSEKFTRGQAWVDLILLANHKQKVVRIRGVDVVVRRGQLAWSEVSLSARWQWSRMKTRRYLDDLKTRHQIETAKNNVTTLITIINYEKYQTDETPNRDRQRDSERDTNKNVKNVKNKPIRARTRDYPQARQPSAGGPASRQQNTIASPEAFVEEFHRRKAQGWRGVYGKDLVCLSGNQIRLKIFSGEFVDFNDSLLKITWIK